MIVWLNGAFGVGKTSTATHLATLVPSVRLYDPEPLGLVLQHTVGRLQRGDFQHLRSWRRGAVLLTRRAARGDAIAVVPMTVLRPDYLDELLARLRESGHDVRHVTLDATAPVLHARIAGADVPERTTQWRRRHIDIYHEVKAELADRGEVVDTTGRSAAEVAGALAGDLFAAY